MLLGYESFVRIFAPLADEKTLKIEFKKLQEYESQEIVELDTVDLEMLIEELAENIKNKEG